MKCWVNTECVKLQPGKGCLAMTGAMCVVRLVQNTVCTSLSGRAGKGSREEVSPVSPLTIDKNRFMFRSFDYEQTYHINYRNRII